jgi:hypothetical protein
MLSTRLGEPVVRGSFTIFPSEFLATQLEVSSMGIGLRFFHARATVMLIALAGSMSGEAAAAPPNGQPPLAVMIDHARVVKLPERTQTVIVGNPSIADVTVQRNGIMVVTGKSYGVTNLIALDGGGALLSESLISVQAPSDSVVTVQRGLERESYSCTPSCQPSLLLGDANKYFGEVGGQATQRNALASQTPSR